MNAMLSSTVLKDSSVAIRSGSARTAVGAAFVGTAFGIVCEGSRWVHAAQQGLLPADLFAPFESHPVIVLAMTALSVSTLLPGCVLIGRQAN